MGVVVTENVHHRSHKIRHKLLKKIRKIVKKDGGYIFCPARLSKDKDEIIVPLYKCIYLNSGNRNILPYLNFRINLKDGIVSVRDNPGINRLLDISYKKDTPINLIFEKVKNGFVIKIPVKVVNLKSLGDYFNTEPKVRLVNVTEYVLSLDEHLQVLINDLDNAQYLIVVASSYINKFSKFYKPIVDALERASKRGVQIIVITFPDEKYKKLYSKNKKGFKRLKNIGAIIERCKYHDSTRFILIDWKIIYNFPSSPLAMTDDVGITTKEEHDNIQEIKKFLNNRFLEDCGDIKYEILELYKGMDRELEY